ncbi:MAG: hypothetical protein IJ068_07355 [Bacilli bacterium]|nr:hypothetical protein [Bacilli bacterium]
MNLYIYYSNLIIEPLEKEIKYLKRRINKKINLTRNLDKHNLVILQTLLLDFYKRYYILKEIDR